MDGFLVQDWVTIRGAASVTLTQPEVDWCDLDSYQDVVAWLEVKEFTNGALAIAYQTSPTKDDSLFVNMSQSYVAVGVSTTIMLKAAMPGLVTPATAAVPSPLARWFRWQLSASSGTWDITFRLWLAANWVGLRKISSAGGPIYAGSAVTMQSQGSQGSSSGSVSWFQWLIANMEKEQPTGTLSDVPAPEGSQSTGHPTPQLGDW